MPEWRVVRGGPESLPNVATRSAASRFVRNVAFILLLICVAAAPLPVGAVFPGGQFAIEILAFGAAALAFSTRAKEERLGAAAIPIICLLMIAVIGCFQLIPMSLTALRRVAPSSAQIYNDSNAVLRLFGHSSVAARI